MADFWVGISVHKCSAKISGLCRSCFSPACRQHCPFCPTGGFSGGLWFGLRPYCRLWQCNFPLTSWWLVFIQAAQSVQFGLCYDRLFPMLWFCLICLDRVILVTVEVSTLNGFNARLVSQACPHLLRKWCLFLIRSRFTCSNMICCVSRVHDVSSTALFWRRDLNVINVYFWARINIWKGQKRQTA